MIYQGSDKTPVTGAVLHCAGIVNGQFKDWSAMQVFREVNRWHVERGFKYIGYHALVMPDGKIFECRNKTEYGAHVMGHNRGTLGILLIESRKVVDHIVTLPKREWRHPVFSDWYTSAQRIALQRYLSAIHGLEWVKGHNDFAPKLCPGFKVETDDWLNGVRFLRSDNQALAPTA